MNRNKIIMAILSAALSTAAVAESSDTWFDDPEQYRDEQRAHRQIEQEERQEERRERLPLNEPVPMKYIVTIGLGPASNGGGTSQTFFLQPDIEKTYTATSTRHTLVMGALFAGVQVSASETLAGQLGLEFVAASSTSFSGDIWEDADPDFDNYTYNYSVSHAHLAVKGKALMNVCNYVTPYVSGSFGYGSNRASGFTITPKIYEEVPAPAFESGTTTAFTYTLGVGVQTMLKSNWQVGLGYEFSGWGSSQLERAPGQTLNSGLGQSGIYTNALMLSITFAK